MKNKSLIFIPYQDSDNFLSDGILTREFSMLYLLWDAGYKKVINVKKPRTCLDKKKYSIVEDYYPNGTKEYCVKVILENSSTIQYLPLLSLRQILQRRVWWDYGYKKTIDYLRLEKDTEYLIYSNNPFAVELLEDLAQKGCKVFFDVMDNFAIHPSLSENERRVAFEGYKKIFLFADYVSANSQQTVDFMQKYCEKNIHLVKNGVFNDNNVINGISINEVKLIKEKKKKYRKCAGYVGKIGLRLDADLIDEISKECKDVLFIFVGGYLKGQLNQKLIELFDTRENVLHIESVPSAYVYPILDEFDILTIPHSVGNAENGGDPLKLYQYLTRNKPIITTPILGVEEFKDVIKISMDYKEWISYLSSNPATCYGSGQINYTWEKRISPILNEVMVENE